jgi:hypothetical protein
MSSTKIGDKVLRIPKLDVAGSNWVIYKDRFTWSIDARAHYAVLYILYYSTNRR